MDSETTIESDDLNFRQMVDINFRSPRIVRRPLEREAVIAHSARNSRRAKSTEPVTLTSNDPFCKKSDEDPTESSKLEPDIEQAPVNARTQEMMSKTQLLNSYRLLINEKLRLERFLSIMSKNNEMARNRLESDLLDAMMCIEDLKQALELRMARRQRVDPREAEERRYLIRQNKKLLNKLYESAKKIERLELTKVEMKEQLDLLDFQILEVENQKLMMEEELRKLPSCNNIEIQTEDDSDSTAQAILRLQEQVNSLQSDLRSRSAEAAAAVAKQQHLDNLVRELRRDNVELRDQMAKMDDLENSLAESDKPLAAGNRELQSQLEEQLERVHELEIKLNTSKDYIKHLESRIDIMGSEEKVTETDINSSSMNQFATQAVMHKAAYDANTPDIRAPLITDLLLQETIRTFHALIAEKDQELAYLRKLIRTNQPSLNASDEHMSAILPPLFEASVQTDLSMWQAENLSKFADTLAEGGIVLTADQGVTLSSQIKRSLHALDFGNVSDSAKINESMHDKQTFCVVQLLSSVNELREKVEMLKNMIKITGITQHRSSEFQFNVDDLYNEQHLRTVQSAEKLGSTIDDIRFSHASPDSESIHVNPAALQSLSEGVNQKNSNPKCTDNCETKPVRFDLKLEELRAQGEVELLQARIVVLERRRQDLENRLMEMTEEVVRARAESRTSETSLSAARRTEAALRRRLLFAMDVQGTDNNANRHSFSSCSTATFEVHDALELQATVVKLEAMNASHAEAVQMDRNRLHDQAMRIGQLEAERRTLLDKISNLQTTEANAQRGIVRLQALYEDMLREYSESCSQELSRRSRERSRSNYRPKTDAENGKKGLLVQQSNSALTKLQEKVAFLQAENQSLNNEINNMCKNNAQLNTSFPVGQCSVPTCVEVRRLLQVFQDRFAGVVGELDRTQQCLNALTMHKFSSILPSDAHCSTLIASLQQHLRALNNSLKRYDTFGNGIEELDVQINNCLDILTNLDDWLKTFIQRSDAELTQLRKAVLGMGDRSTGDSQSALPTDTCCQQPNLFSWSVQLFEKQGKNFPAVQILNGSNRSHNPAALKINWDE